MKLPLTLAAVLMLLGCEKQVTLPELNYNNIKYLTLASMSPEQINQVAVNYFKADNFTEYQQIEHDEDKFNQKIQSIAADFELKQQQSSRLYTFTAPVYTKQYNPLNQSFNLMAPFRGNILTLSKNSREAFFSNYIFVTLADIDRFFSVPKNEFNEFNEMNLNLKAVYTVEIVESQYVDYLQAVFRQVDVYETNQSPDLIYSFKEQRSGESIVASRLLSGGYSSDFLAIHSFTFFGKRILDIFYDIGFHNEACQKQNTVLNHQLIACRYEYAKYEQGAVYIDVLVVGGKMAEIKLQAKGIIPELAQKNLLNRASTDLNLKPTFLEGKGLKNKAHSQIKQVNKKIKPPAVVSTSSEFDMSWEYFGTLISYDSAALKLKTDDIRTVFNLTGISWLEYQKGAVKPLD